MRRFLTLPVCTLLLALSGIIVGGYGLIANHQSQQQVLALQQQLAAYPEKAQLDQIAMSLRSMERKLAAMDKRITTINNDTSAFISVVSTNQDAFVALKKWQAETVPLLERLTATDTQIFDILDRSGSTNDAMARLDAFEASVDGLKADVQAAVKLYLELKALNVSSAEMVDITDRISRASFLLTRAMKIMAEPAPDATQDFPSPQDMKGQNGVEGIGGDLAVDPTGVSDSATEGQLNNVEPADGNITDSGESGCMENPPCS